MQKHKTVVFLMLPLYSHVSIAFQFATTLKQLGYNVFFACTNKFEAFIISNGFEFLKLSDDDYPFDVSDKKIVVKSQNYLKIFRHYWKRNRNQAENLINNQYFTPILQVDPAFLLVDHYFSPYAYSLKDKAEAFYHLDTTVTLTQNDAKPPFNSSYIPSEGYLSKSICRLLWWQYFMKRKLNPLRYPLLSVAVKKLIYKKGGDANDLVENCMYGISYKGIPVINLTWKAWDFPQIVPSNYYYFGAQYVDGRIDNTIDKRFDKEFPAMVKSGKRIVFLSFGTLSSKMNNIIQYFEKVISMLNERDDVCGIIQIDDSLMIQKFRMIAAAPVFIYKKVPQIRILNEMTGVMITHGGTNSIQECIWHQVPMLCVPSSKEVDHFGNSARACYHGLARIGSIYDKQEKIAEDIDQLLTNEAYGLALSAMKKKVQHENVNDIRRTMTELFDNNDYHSIDQKYSASI